VLNHLFISLNCCKVVKENASTSTCNFNERFFWKKITKEIAILNLKNCQWNKSLQIYQKHSFIRSVPRNPYWSGRISTVGLHVLTSSDQLLLIPQKYFLFYKTSCLNEEINCTEPSPSVSVPCSCPRYVIGALPIVILWPVL